MMKNYYQQHQNLLKRFRLAIQKEFPDCRGFERHVGLFYTIKGTPVKINKPGMSDLWYLFPINNICMYMEFEVKSGDAIKTKEQKQWASFLNKMNTGSIEVRDDNFDFVFIEIKKRLSFYT